MHRSTLLLVACAAVLGPAAFPGLTRRLPAQETGDAGARGNAPPAAGREAPGVPPGTVFPVDPSEVRRPEARIARASGTIELDGRLDENAWQAADRITRFVQSMPATGSPATEETVVRVLYDDENLYIGADLYDAAGPEGITVHSLEREYETHDSDVFGVTLDPFLDRRNSFMFLVNPRGAIKDGQTFDNSRTINLSWDGIVERAARVHENGWSVEMAIPFRTLRFEGREGPQSWGMQFLRRIRRKAEDDYWAPVDRRTRLHKMADAGTLHDLRGLDPGSNVRVKPYLLTAASRVAEAAGPGTGPAEETELEAGVDVKYGLTPRLTLDLTYNTDFSQVEVDQERVNLTRFSLFFPEKRDFFVENSGIFAFGDQSERNYRLGASPRDFTLFHSRRIGLEDGQPVPILGGARLTGRVGEMEVGLLNMQTRATADAAPENLSAVRVRHTFLGALQVGGIFLNRQSTGDPTGPGAGSPADGGTGGGEAPAEGDAWNRSYGIDANLTLFENLIVHSYLAGSRDAADLEGSHRAARVSAAWRDAFWDVSAMYREMGDAFRPEMGFVRRGDMRHTYATVGVHPRPAWEAVVAVNPFVEMDYITDLESVLETRRLTGGVDVDFVDGSQLQLRLTDRFERILEPFDVSAATIPTGAYDFTEGSVQYQSSAGRSLAGRIQYATGGFFGGRRQTLEGAALWRPTPHLALDLTAQHNVLELDGDEFTADVVRGRLQLSASTRLFGTAYVQYNEATGEVITNLRANLIHAPLSDLFVVYRERRDTGGDGVRDRRVTVKATRLFSF